MPDPELPPAARLVFRRAPAAIPGFVRAAFDRRPARLGADATSPRIEGRIEALEWSAGQLSRFRRVCGFPRSGQLPLTFPHVLAAGLHARMLLCPEFPVRLPGLIHVWHEIQRHRLPMPGEKLSMECWIEGHNFVPSGAEFCLHTRVITDGEPLWEEKTGFLSRAGRREDVAPIPPREIRLERPRHVAGWSAAPGVGRRYARASGDYNPIHLHDAAARPFGFPSAIAHGMWTLSRSVAELERDRGAPCRSVYVRFKRPVFIPSELCLLAGVTADEQVPFKVSDTENSVDFIEGLWQG